MKNFLAVCLLALASLLYFHGTAEAQGTPCQWNYSIVNDIATATYCGNVTAEGSIIPSAGQKDLFYYGALCNGTADDSTAIKKSLSAQESAIAPAGRICYVNPADNNGITISNNQLVTSEQGGGYKAGPTQNWLFKLTGSFSGLTNSDLNINGAKTGVIISSTESNPITAPYILNNHYHGATQSGGVYEDWIGDSDGTHTQFGYGIVNPLSAFNTQDQLDQSTVSNNFVFEATKGGHSIGDRCLNDNGFCFETKWTYDTQIDDLQAIGVDYGSTQTAVSTSLDFTVATPVSHCGIVDNTIGAVINPTITGCSAVGTTVTASGLTQSHSYTLHAYRSLEAVSINSDSYNTTLRGANILNRGDNGVTIATDYHCDGSTCTLGSSTAADAPFNNVFNNNVIDGTLLAGIGIDSFCSDLSAKGNTISNYSQGILWGSSQNAFSAGITATYTTQSPQCKFNVGTNNINNSRNLGRYGISINGFPYSYGTAEQLINIADQNFTGAFSQEYYTPFNGSLGVCTIRRINQPVIPIQSQPDFDTSFGAGTNPSASTFWEYSASGTGWTQSATIKQGGTNSVQTTPNAYVDMLPNSESYTTSVVAPNGIAVFKVWAKSSAPATSSTGSYIELFTRNGGSADLICGPLVITSTTWQLYEIDASYEAQQGMYSIRIGEPADGVYANFQYPWLGVQRIQ